MCGIWAVINQEESLFDYQSFCTLGCANDRRGGDSCGIFIDGKVEYGIGQKAKFEDFFWDSELLNNVTTAKIALGHDRKASIGGITLEKAHPIIIEEDVPVAEGEEPRKEIKFVMVHNGTIYDYEALAKKYIPDVDVKGMSDSQVIARILYYAGFDFLAEYNGGAAFIAVDYRGKEPEIIIWRGESKKYSTSTEQEEERPLYCNLENNRLVISSIPSYLHIVDGNCYTVPENKVLCYKNNKLYIIKEIDRSKAQQNKKYDWPATNTTTSYTNGTAYGSFIRTLEYNNTYKSESKCLDGLFKLSMYGKILGKNESSAVGSNHQVWFFNGIALKEHNAYKFLVKALKRTGLTVEDFTIMYQNMIRYFSVDQLYFDSLILYKATTPWTREPFNGEFQMLTEGQRTTYKQGTKSGIEVDGLVSSSFDIMKDVPKYDYRTIWKEFIQSIA